MGAHWELSGSSLGALGELFGSSSQLWVCYPLLFPHGEPGFTNEMKDRIPPADYVMARMLMPEKIGCKFMTAPARNYSETQIFDSHIGEPFVSDEDVDQVDQHAMQIYTRQFLRVNQSC